VNSAPAVTPATDPTSATVLTVDPLAAPTHLLAANEQAVQKPERTSESTLANSGFAVRLDEFEGPFDLLLSLIAKHRLDVTVLALHRVVDDFVAHLRSRGPDWDLDETTEFLVIAATLLDLKAARLLPSGEVEDEEDIALLDARDLLFARLLQYRAFRDVAGVLAARFASAAIPASSRWSLGSPRCSPRSCWVWGPLSSRLLPPVQWHRALRHPRSRWSTYTHPLSVSGNRAQSCPHGCGGPRRPLFVR
jgi:hypothetical protein